jgi:uncharacterized damage-inducible protein DinB
MARYNAQQNNWIRRIVNEMPDEELRLDRGAFFGSIFGTLNHLLLGDQLWMARFEGVEGPVPTASKGTDLTPNIAVWSGERVRMDLRIKDWARQIKTIDLTGDISWHSKIYNRDFSESKALCVAHLFNHQTHHRGQVHAMLTAAGQTPDDTDLPTMTDD